MINERGCWMSEEETDTHEYDSLLAFALVRVFDIKTAVDVGCGNGRYTLNFIENGIDCIGYDGSPLTPKLTKGLYFIKDFSDLVDIGQFDLVLCLEVGEHIPVEYEDIFINNLCRASKKFICLSWAVEGQWGRGHVNCRENDYIIGEMDKRGFGFHAELTKCLRNMSMLPWFVETILVFKKC